MEPNNINSSNKSFKKTAWIWIVSVLVIVLIIAGLYASHVARNEALQSAQSSANSASQTQNATQTNEQTIDIKHQYANGTHTYVGSIDVPTPCDKISADVNADASADSGTAGTAANNANFTLTFTTIAPPATATSSCAQVITSVPFEVTFPGPQNANVNATLDGKPVILNVFEIPAGQNINSSIYLKG